MLSLFILIGLFVVVVLLITVFLWLGARWQHVAGASFWRAFGAVLLPALALAAIHALATYQRKELMIRLCEWTEWSNYQLASSLLLAAEATAAGIACLLAAKLLLWATWRQALLAWLPTSVPVAATIVFIFAVLHPFLLEPMQVRYGAMCPTLLSITQATDCPACGARAYTPWTVVPAGPDGTLGQLCMCSECQRAFRSHKFERELNEPDSFLVNKLLAPRRWDIVVYRPIHLPYQMQYRVVRRVVGMPGEEVVIKEGGVWINGARLQPPSDIAGIEFLDRFDDDTPILSGSVEKPARLGDDEYFVIGDYSYRSSDSRTWPVGLEGRAQYALPAWRIEGVVDLRYAPWGRWYSFR